MTYLTNREAALHLCNGGKLEVLIDDKWQPGTCLITISPDKGSPVKITSDDQVGPETVFLD